MLGLIKLSLSCRWFSFDLFHVLLWQDLYIGIGWPLHQKYGHAFEITLRDKVGAASFDMHYYEFEKCSICRHLGMILTDSVLGSLTSKVEQAGSDGQEVLTFRSSGSALGRITSNGVWLAN